MREFTYDGLPARIVFGAGAARTQLPTEVDRLGVTRILLVASSRDTERVHALIAPFADRIVGTFADVREHIPLEIAEAARERAGEARADALLAIGGGSTVGVAKAVALTARIPIIAVPTTYAGSEVTPVWGLTEHGRKATGTDPAVLPRVVVYDPELVASLPRALAVASGLNAMAHAVESLWAPGRNPATSGLAEEGIAALATGLRANDPSDLLTGAWLAGSAFAVTGSGLHHKLCHVLGGIGLPHARTHAVVLPHVLAFNAPGAPEAAARVARALGRSGVAVADPVGALRELADQLDVPHGLRELGLREDQLDTVAALAEPAVPEDNPVPVGGGALRRLVQAAWAGDTTFRGRSRA